VVSDGGAAMERMHDALGERAQLTSPEAEVHDTFQPSAKVVRIAR
jgi:hypothetical protein